MPYVVLAGEVTVAFTQHCVSETGVPSWLMSLIFEGGGGIMGQGLISIALQVERR